VVITQRQKGTSTVNNITALPPLDEKRRYSLAITAEYLGICRPYLHEKIAAGEIKAIRDGRRRFVSGSEIARLSRA
jgi:excisionase family DNA binding protein